MKPLPKNPGPRGDDVRFAKCIMCRSPSSQGLCDRCARGPGPRQRDHTDGDALKFTKREWVMARRKPAQACTCASCNARRGGEPQFKPSSWATIGRRG